MARADEFIFGYSRGKVDNKDVCKLTNTLLRLGICSDVTKDGDFTLRQKDRARFLSSAKSRLRFSLSEPLGIHGFILKNKHRYGLFAALITLVIIFAFTGSLVWDVRISGNVALSASEVENTLSQTGLCVGSRWHSIDKNELEASLLATHPEIAWISVNRRGTVAYVELIESENVLHKEETAPLYSNIVAECDGVIEEIAVKSGEAMVKVGDVVRKGDVLISGVIANELGVRFCRAQGTVRAHAVTDVKTEIGREISLKTEIGRRVAQVRILIFNFSVNIFKNYRNCGNNCDIIEETKKFALFGGAELPVSLKKTYVTEYKQEIRRLSDGEMASLASQQLDDLIRMRFCDADIIKLRTSGEFDDGVYRLTTRVVYSTDIGIESAIEIN